MVNFFMNRPFKNISGPRIAARRKVCRPPVTQAELARRVQADGVALDRVAIAKIEGGHRGVLDYELVALARALATTPARLLKNPEKKRHRG